MLDERKAAILGALVEDHIACGAPVSSRAILDRSGLDCSSATVRNELVALEGLGFVAQPHTSAGRVPTDRGYRYYVDHLSPGSLRSVSRGKIDTFFASIHAEFDRILRETSDLLSDITEYPAVVLGPGLRGHEVKDVHLLPVDPGVVLAIVVTTTGRVHQALLRPATPATPVEIEEATAALVDAVVGAELGGDIDIVPEGLSPPAAGVVERAAAVLEGALDSGREIFVGGTSRMVDLWEDLAKLHRVLGLLEKEASLFRLLDDRSEGTSVRLGSEIAAAEQDLAVVSSGYQAAAGSGRMGVLGPMRMDYRRAIRAVEEVSDALGESLNH